MLSLCCGDIWLSCFGPTCPLGREGLSANQYKLILTGHHNSVVRYFYPAGSARSQNNNDTSPHGTAGAQGATMSINMMQIIFGGLCSHKIPTLLNSPEGNLDWHVRQASLLSNHQSTRVREHLWVDGVHLSCTTAGGLSPTGQLGQSVVDLMQIGLKWHIGDMEHWSILEIFLHDQYPFIFLPYSLYTIIGITRVWFA